MHNNLTSVIRQLRDSRGGETSVAFRLTAIQETYRGSDKVFVNAFLRNAEELFTTARQDAGEDCQFSVLVGADGGIHMVFGSEWGLEPLRQHHGAREAYRVTRSAGCVVLEGRSTGASCRLEAVRPAHALPGLSAQIPWYATAL
jgi:hypothetical protein